MESHLTICHIINTASLVTPRTQCQTGSDPLSNPFHVADVFYERAPVWCVVVRVRVRDNLHPG